MNPPGLLCCVFDPREDAIESEAGRVAAAAIDSGAEGERTLLVLFPPRLVVPVPVEIFLISASACFRFQVYCCCCRCF